MRSRTSRILAVLLVALLAIPALAERTALKPGFNIFSPQQDVEMGRQLSKEAEARIEIFRDLEAGGYIDALGKRLASKAPAVEHYSFQFKIVNDRTINAFGLPGGLVYVHSGTIEAADHEAQLAGVIAHEIGHIALRHGTHQVSNAYVLQTPISRLGAIGGVSVTSVLEKIGGGFTASSFLLRNPHELEVQADRMAAQILYDAGYDPKAMAQFLKKLAAEGQGVTTKPAFSDHPKPEDRIDNVNREIEKLGGPPPNAILDSPGYQAVRLRLSRSPGQRPARTSPNPSSPTSERPQAR